MSFDMDKMRNKSVEEDLNKAVTNAEELEILKRSDSPVFKCVNTKPSRAPDSSDYDIPSYQLNQSLKTTTCSKNESEANDFVLPFSPIFSPIPVSTVQFQPPSIHSVGTVVKNMEKATKKVKETDQLCVFQSLGMTDKDISWVSSMASPPPKQVPGCEFNTIEKATFFPEVKFQNIQPRALFSPASDSDFGCQPISSDSDEGEAYKTNVRLSDVCATLKQLEFKSLESDIKDNSLDFSSSPVIKMKKLESVNKKREVVLVKSPQDSYEFSVSDVKFGFGKTKDGSTLIEDDSFQSMSFSCLDELCKTVTEQTETNKFNIEKKFYLTKSTDKVFRVSSLNGLYSYARALEQGDKIVGKGKKLDKSVTSTNIVRFDKLEDSKSDAMKRSHSEVSETKDESNEKKVKMVDDSWENVKEYLSESQLNVSDSEIFKTVENLEKSLASQESRESKLSSETQSQEKNKEVGLKNNPSDTCEEADMGTKAKPACGIPEVVFATASGTEISVSEKSLARARQIMRECDEANRPISFSAMSGKFIQVSEKALEKAKLLMSECEAETPTEEVSKTREKLSCLRGAPEDIKKTAALLEYCGKDVRTQSFQGFSTGSGKPIEVSPKALKAKSLILPFGVWKPTSKANSTCAEVLVKSEPENLTKLKFPDFSTGSVRQIKVSDEALKKAKAFMDECSETLEVIKPEKSNLSFKGFMSGSGKEIQVSDEALNKAKALMEDCGDERSMNKVLTDAVKEEVKPSEINKQSVVGFYTGSGRNIQVSAEALEKAKEMMRSESPDELASIWMGELADESFADVMASETGGQGRENWERRSKEVVQVEAEAKELEKSGMAEGDDWEEIVPSWLHVYNTSPSMASDRLELSPLVSHENGNTSKPEREYIKSPVLGANDRFYQKFKKRKLEFKEEERGNVGVRRTAKREWKLAIDFSAPFKKAKLMDEEDAGADVKEGRRCSREEQERAVKKKEKVKPVKGLLLGRKCKEKQMKWVEAVGESSPQVHSEESLRRMGVREEVVKVRVDNAVDFRFEGEHFLGSGVLTNVEGMAVGDGCLVILDDENRFGVEELKRGFLAAPGVQPNLLPCGWVENHYKWIVWKLAHYERSLPRFFAGRCLTPNNVALQLKYRYDREIDRSERSALKKILERDDTPVKRMVLCVCGMRKVSGGEASGYELSLTDGWYSCPTRVDAAMSRLIEEGKVCVGTKLMTQGATLVNCEQGASPLEIGEDVYLKISTNSTRRVKWDTKLGYQKNPENFLIPLGSILPQGGAISRLDVIIVRVYPILYMEKMSDGHYVTRNWRSEERAEAEYRRVQEQRMEKVWREVESEMRSELESDGDEKEGGLSQLVGGCSDPITLMGSRTWGASQAFNPEFSEKVEKRFKKERIEKRKVSAFLRAKIVDFRRPDYNNPATLSVWNPSEELLGILCEGKVLSLMNISISNSSRAYKTVQINTGRQTQFRVIERAVKYPRRKLTGLSEVSSKVCPAFGEVDVVGMVTVIRDVAHGSRLSQVVYLTDWEFHLVGLVFWGSRRDYGWENVLKVRSIVACSNLQWKKWASEAEVPSVHVSENSVFTENPGQEYLKEEIGRLKETMPKDLDEFLSRCEEELTVRLEGAKWKGNRSMEKWRNNVSNGFQTKPSASSTPIKAFPARLSPGPCAEPSPIQKRIEKLQKYGEPPTLAPLLVRNMKVKKKS